MSELTSSSKPNLRIQAPDLKLIEEMKKLSNKERNKLIEEVKKMKSNSGESTNGKK